MFTLTQLHGNRAVNGPSENRGLTPVFPVFRGFVMGLLLAGCASAQLGLGLAPMREELNLDPGASHSGVLTLANDGVDKTRVTAEILDFYLDTTGTPQFGAYYKQESAFSCRDWLAANPMDMEINGKSQVQIRYTVRTPQNATPRSYHCAVSFTTAPVAGDGGRMGLRTAVQIVASIYVVVGKPAADGTVKDLKLEYTPGTQGAGWSAVVTFNNPSLMHYRPSGDLDVINEGGQVVDTEKFVPLPVLPARDQNFILPIKLPSGPGKYTLRARVDLGGNEIQEATAHVVAAVPSR